MNLEQLKFPIGKAVMPAGIEDIDIPSAIEDIACLPEDLMDLTLGLNPENLEQTYRPEGWNIRQLVHHLADSHMNAFIRFKLVFTEDDGTAIRPYYEDRWAITSDIDDAIEDSLMILRGVHNRWAKLAKSFTPTDLEKSYFHPEMKKNVALFQALATYQWHGKHHLAHIQSALAKME